MTPLSPEQARDYLVGSSGLRAVQHPRGRAGVRALLDARRCIQLDPLDTIGTNADLVALARVDGIKKGDVYRHLLPGAAFEHFAKERCLIPAARFGVWRSGAHATPWWRTSERMRKLPPGVLDAVEAEVRSRGPIALHDLQSRGRTAPMDWSGWKGTPKVAKLAAETLWRQCRIVVCGRTARGKIVDVPDRALAHVVDLPHDHNFDRTVLLDRVEAAGLLAETSGPHWSMLYDVRGGPLPEQLIAEGLLERVTITGGRRTYLAPAGFRDRGFPADDGRMRILGPLDPMIWDRKLVEHVFGFRYVWEVYKPAAKRTYGWYVVPLLHDGRLVGRMEAHVEGGEVVVDTRWLEDGAAFDEDAYAAAIRRHAEAVAGLGRAHKSSATAQPCTPR